MFYKNFTKFVGKYLCWSLFFKNLQGWAMQLYQNRDSAIAGFFVNIVKISRTLILQKNLRGIVSAFLLKLFSKDLLTFWRVSDLAQRNAFLFAQNQPPEVFSKKRGSWKFCDIHRKTPVLEPLFNNVAGNTRLQIRCFSVDVAKFLGTPTLMKICKRLLLFLIYWVIIAMCFWQYIFSYL